MYCESEHAEKQEDRSRERGGESKLRESKIELKINRMTGGMRPFSLI